MLPPEREMYEEILTSVRTCRSRLIEPEMEGMSAPVVPVESAVSVDYPAEEGSSGTKAVAESAPASPEEPDGYEPVYISGDIDSFMGLDGRIYTLSKEDIVMLPEKNASVLYGRNIALNIRVGK
jgi:DNA replication factor GINS